MRTWVAAAAALLLLLLTPAPVLAKKTGNPNYNPKRIGSNVIPHKVKPLRDGRRGATRPKR